jgi:hypothetical protein
MTRNSLRIRRSEWPHWLSTARFGWSRGWSALWE